MGRIGGQARPLHWTPGQDAQRNLGSSSPATAFLLYRPPSQRAKETASSHPELSLGAPSLGVTPGDLCLDAGPYSHWSQEPPRGPPLPSHPLGPELGLSMMQIWASLLCFQMLWPRCRPSNCLAGSSHGGPVASGPPFHGTCVHPLVLGTLVSLQIHHGSGPLHVLLPRLCLTNGMLLRA